MKYYIRWRNCENKYIFTWEALSVLSTTLGMIVGTIILGVTVYQLVQQNKIQNELDKRQKKFEQREEYQIQLNIKQALFVHILSGWKITKALFLSVEGNTLSIDKEGVRKPYLVYITLTNNFYLKGVQNALGTMNLVDREWRKNPKIQNN